MFFATPHCGTTPRHRIAHNGSRLPQTSTESGEGATQNHQILGSSIPPFGPWLRGTRELRSSRWWRWTQGCNMLVGFVVLVVLLTVSRWRWCWPSSAWWLLFAELCNVLRGVEQICSELLVSSPVSLHVGPFNDLEHVVQSQAIILEDRVAHPVR